MTTNELLIAYEEAKTAETSEKMQIVLYKLLSFIRKNYDASAKGVVIEIPTRFRGKKVIQKQYRPLFTIVCKGSSINTSRGKAIIEHIYEKPVSDETMFNILMNVL